MNRGPAIILPADLETEAAFYDLCRRIPMIGERVPRGWKRISVRDVGGYDYSRYDAWFVDSSGFGRPGEPAYTIEDFYAALRRFVSEHTGTWGLGIWDAGPFQVNLGMYRRVGLDRAEPTA